jgi:preprotein translocase subunit SecG
MEQIILVVHLLVALAIIGLILMQQGKGADIGASFGAGASQTLFGSTGSGNVLSRATGWLAAAFFVTSFTLAVIASNQTADEEDLGFTLPEAAQSTSTDLPVLDSDPAASDVPAMDVEEAPAEPVDSDLPIE